MSEVSSSEVIDYLSADSLSATASGVAFSVGPAGFDARCSHRDSDHLEEAAASPESPLGVFCELELRDEKIELIAFSSAERRQLYRDARKVSGIGTASAVALLDCGEPLDILRAAAAEEVAFFRVVPGLGAQKISRLITALRKGRAGTLPQKLPTEVSVWVEARDLLRADLGCDLNTAEAALRVAAGATAERRVNAVELAEAAAAAVRERLAR